jgi:hypothetical protein
MVAGGLLSLGGLASPGQAQDLGAPLADPLPVGISGPPTPVPSPKPPFNPFSLKNDGSPNGFSDEDGLPPTQAPFRIWLRGEYINWHVKSGNIGVPLVTSTTAPNINNNFGAFGQSNTFTVIGPGSYNFGNVPGGRVTLGLAPTYLPPFEVTGFWLNRSQTLFAAGSDGSLGSPVIARPLQFADRPGKLNLPTESVALVNFPGGQAGAINISDNLSFWGTEVNFFYCLGQGDCASLSVLLGYKYANLTDAININSTTMALPGVLLPFGGDPAGFGNGNTISAADSFRARNQFNGANLGLRGALSAWRITLATDLKLALGNTNQSLTTSGYSSINTAGSSQVTLPGGVLNTASMNGSQSQNRFSIIPELNVNARFRICDNIHVFAGYNLMYWSNVIRAGDHISRSVNSAEVPGSTNFDPTFHPAQHLVPLHNTNFFANGYNIGLEVGF